MKHEQRQRVEILGDTHRFSVTELCRICHVDEACVLELIEYQVISADVDEAAFSRRQLDRLLKASRLQRDLDINAAGAALALDLLETIDELKRDIHRLRLQVTT